MKTAFLFSAFSGLRYSDVKALVWRKVKQVKGGSIVEFAQVKTGDVESLPLSDQATAILETQAGKSRGSRGADDAIFSFPAQQTLGKTIRRRVKRADIEKKISFQCARHTFAPLGLTHGVDLYTMSKLLGHRDVSTTQIYAKIIDQKP